MNVNLNLCSTRPFSKAAAMGGTTADVEDTNRPIAFDQKSPSTSIARNDSIKEAIRRENCLSWKGCFATTPPNKHATENHQDRIGKLKLSFARETTAGHRPCHRRSNNVDFAAIIPDLPSKMID
jgi:hypothetical protein